MVFDEPTLVSHARLVPAMALAAGQGCSNWPTAT